MAEALSRCWLRVAIPGRDESRYELADASVRIGRSSDNDIPIADLSLSREHAQIDPDSGGYRIRDLGSRNGTFLNDGRISEPTFLSDRDVVRLGDSRLLFREEPISGVRLSTTARALHEGTLEIKASEIISGNHPVTVTDDGRVVDVIARVSRMLIGPASASDVCRNVLQEAVAVVGGERGAVMRIDSEGDLQPAACYGAEELLLSRSIAGKVIQEGASLITTDAQLDPRFDASNSIHIQGIRAALCAPLIHDDRVSGLLYIDRRFSARSFSQVDLALVTVLANLAAAKLDNIGLQEEAQAKRRLEEEMALAAEIQRNLLPASEPTFPGWEFAGTSFPSRSVGGDLYDYIELDRDRMAVVVADVSGKGTSAALLMACLQANLRAFATGSASPSEALALVNRALARSTAGNKFATVFVAELGAKHGMVRYVNGGHTPGLVVRRDRIDRLTVGGMIVGAFADRARYQTGTVELEPDDLLVLYSDGITEAERADAEMFGVEGLEAVVRGAHGCGAAELRDMVLDAVHEYTAGRPPTDDTTLVVARRN